MRDTALHAGQIFSGDLTMRAVDSSGVRPWPTRPQSTEPGPVRVLVVDSHPLMRWALTQITAERTDTTVVGEAATATEALALAYAIQPDVITIECTTNDGEGWTLATRLREANPTLGIVILTADATDQLLLRALHLGASAFVSKSAPIPDVLAAIRYAAAAPTSFSAAGLADALRRKNTTTNTINLSTREHEILVLLHDGLSVPAIATRLYVSLSTAKTYVARLYEKLGARNRAQALMTAVRLGMFDDQLSRVV
jgi:DNA-binding NarL/FixJ family response regulator